MSTEQDTREARIQAYALGWLCAQDRAELDALAQSDPTLYAELALARAMAQASAEDPQRSAVDELAWARLARAIDAQAAPLPRAAWLPERFTRWQTAAAMLVAVAVWQFAAVPQLAGEPGDASAGYGMASGARAQAFVAQVIFRPEATEAQMRQALRAAQAQVVAGPSALGIYEVAFTDQRALDAGVARLGAESAVVEEIRAAELDR